MKYRGVEYVVVRKISPNCWRWSVKRDPNDKVGTAPDRETAIFFAQFYIDKLIKTRQRPTTPPKEVCSGE